MTPSEATNAATRQEWRDLGFFYDIDDAAHRWRLVGSRTGLREFSKLLRAYCRNPRNATAIEHDHFGPYMYLKVMTWPDAGVDKASIHGTIDDLQRLAQIVDAAIEKATPDDTIAVAQRFAPGSEYELVLEIKTEGFDPAEADPCLR